jgi:putative transposase
VQSTAYANAFVERFVQTLKVECLDHFVVLGERHLNHLVREFVEYYHELRPHQALENLPPVRGTPTESIEVGEIVCEERLGGLLKHYVRRAA